MADIDNFIEQVNNEYLLDIAGKVMIHAEYGMEGVYEIKEILQEWLDSGGESIVEYYSYNKEFDQVSLSNPLITTIHADVYLYNLPREYVLKLQDRNIYIDMSDDREILLANDYHIVQDDNVITPGIFNTLPDLMPIRRFDISRTHVDHIPAEEWLTLKKGYGAEFENDEGFFIVVGQYFITFGPPEELVKLSDIKRFCNYIKFRGHLFVEKLCYTKWDPDPYYGIYVPSEWGEEIMNENKLNWVDDLEGTSQRPLS